MSAGTPRELTGRLGIETRRKSPPWRRSGTGMGRIWGSGEAPSPYPEQVTSLLEFHKHSNSIHGRQNESLQKFRNYKLKIRKKETQKNYRRKIKLNTQCRYTLHPNNLNLSLYCLYGNNHNRYRYRGESKKI